MSLHELYRIAKGKLDSKEMNTTCAADQSSAPQNDFFELVWENGQISMMGQSSRARKIPTCKSLPSHSLKGQDKDVGYANANANVTNTRMSRFGDLDTGLNEIRMQDEVLPWLNYGMDESLQHDYSSDFLHELSGVTMNELTPSNNFSLLDKRSNCNQVFGDSHKSTSHQCQTSFASASFRVSDINENNASNATQHSPWGETTQIPSASSDLSSLKMDKHDPTMSSNSSTIMNFSHFARPAAVVKANLQNIDIGNNSKGAATAATRSNPPGSTKVSGGDGPKETAMHNQQVLEQSQVDLNPLEPKSLQQNDAVSKQFDPTCKEDVSKNDHTSNLVRGESDVKEHEDVEKRREPVVPSSSVCSGNGAERYSDEQNQNLKRKNRDTEDYECQSEDVEEESERVKKAACVRGAMGSKRSRSAEVHNLSERRRRDRINEKMRALQELIPNCNKVDKASMLDEAIEYLKTLQLQVQIMSMGAGLYMPTMMLPAGMQHIQALHMAPFSPMGVGMPMGFGMGCGMRMPDINGGTSRFPMVQVPQMQGTHLPAAQISGSTGLHGMARSNPQVFGLPSQGLPMPMPHAPLFPFPGDPLMNSSFLGLNACSTAGLMETVDSAPVPNVCSQVMQNPNIRNSACQMSNQCGATTGGFEHSALVHNSGYASEANDSGAVNPGKEDNLLINKSC